MARTKEQTQNDRLRSKYGINIEHKLAMLQRQGGICCICRATLELDEGVVDHCHEYQQKTGGMKIRGILCSSCNSLLGFSKDSVATLASAIQYINKHSI